MDGYCVLEKQRPFDSCFLSLSELVFCFQYNPNGKISSLKLVDDSFFFFHLFKWMRKMKTKSQLIPQKKKKSTQFLNVAYLQALFFWLLKIYIIIFRVSKRFFFRLSDEQKIGCNLISFMQNSNFFLLHSFSQNISGLLLFYCFILRWYVQNRNFLYSES